MQYGLKALYGSQHVPEFDLMERPAAGGRCVADRPRAGGDRDGAFAAYRKDCGGGGAMGAVLIVVAVHVDAMRASQLQREGAGGDMRWCLRGGIAVAASRDRGGGVAMGTASGMERKTIGWNRMMWNQF